MVIPMGIPLLLPHSWWIPCFSLYCLTSFRNFVVPFPDFIWWWWRSWAWFWACDLQAKRNSVLWGWLEKWSKYSVNCDAMMIIDIWLPSFLSSFCNWNILILLPHTNNTLITFPPKLLDHFFWLLWFTPTVQAHLTADDKLPAAGGTDNGMASTSVNLKSTPDGEAGWGARGGGLYWGTWKGPMRTIGVGGRWMLGAVSLLPCAGSPSETYC